MDTRKIIYEGLQDIEKNNKNLKKKEKKETPKPSIRVPTTTGIDSWH